jgi:cytochrome c-type biogenesis protein CcmE
VKRKNQRLTLLVLAVAAVLGAVLLAMSALKDQAAYFYAPGDLARQGYPPADRSVRIGGMVAPGSVKRLPDGVTVTFTVRDDTPHTIAVRYTGILPDLFKEDSGVVAEGRFGADRTFVASEILAKHDENYMPPQLDIKSGEHKSGSLK